MAKNSKKHYSDVEKHLFVELLKEYGPIIEQKKSDASSISAKEEAWDAICEKYNASHIISAKRTVQQLRKLWSNIKAAQRELLTKERQATMATGGGPAPPPVVIDPNVAEVTPHLLYNPPILFSSNSNEETTNERQHIMFSADELAIESMVEGLVESRAEAHTCLHTDTLEVTETNGPVEKRKKKPANSDLEELKHDRIKSMIDDEKKLALLIYEYQKLKNQKERVFLTKKYELDLRKSAAEAELAERLLQNCE